MSIESWKKEFYPLDAADCPAAEAISHSLRKWEGLRQDALRRHQLAACGNLLRETNAAGTVLVNTDYFKTDASSCALCTHYLNLNPPGSCERCPLNQVRGGTNCDRRSRKLGEFADGVTDPYSFWCHKNNPEPMIHWLLQAQAATVGAAEKTKQDDEHTKI